ncbi:hypothetical protein GGX14DRAFT_580060 [Mycena pura]|uniref:Secreted protein n=1 Tax=Mycena pura TaxID=153505 RepID=A0AAD6XZT3_9AGAR|nr:hypothetical protein GGX14DRAFT_580060 [Mycena pura]
MVIFLVGIGIVVYSLAQAKGRKKRITSVEAGEGPGLSYYLPKLDAEGSLYSESHQDGSTISISSTWPTTPGEADPRPAATEQKSEVDFAP